MKYICTEDGEGKEEIFTFPNTVDHDVMAQVISRLKNQSWGNWERVLRHIVSAGFVNTGGICFGRSETLSLDSRPQDTDILRAHK